MDYREKRYGLPGGDSCGAGFAWDMNHGIRGHQAVVLVGFPGS
jgi:hypothetical protein